MILKVKRTHPDAMWKTEGHDSGHDVCVIGVSEIVDKKIKEPTKLENGAYFEILPNQRVLVETGIKLQLPEPVKTKWGEIAIEGQMRPKSSLSTKLKLDVILGTLDNEYTGGCGVILHNFSDEIRVLKKGDKIGQVVLNRIVKFNEEHTLYVDNLGETRRGEWGFGSTGGMLDE